MATVAEFVVEKLSKDHDLSRFDCGNDALNLWLKRFAWANVQNDSARVYVAHRRERVVVGYHALTAGSVSRAVDRAQQGKGLGITLLQDALLRAEHASDTVGVRAVLVQAIDASARSFYFRFAFSPSPVDEMRLMLLMKDLRAFLRAKKL